MHLVRGGEEVKDEKRASDGMLFKKRKNRGGKG